MNQKGDLKMNFKSIDEILNFAIDREKEAVEFYTELSKKESFAAVKETFQNFAREEQKHVNLIQDISGNKEIIDNYEFRKVADLKISDYMVDKEYEDGMPMQEVLRIAMKREEHSVKLYKELAEHADDSEFIRVFNLLAQEEAEHKLALETMYDDYLADQDN